jgi:hypothetical protein
MTERKYRTLRRNEIVRKGDELIIFDGWSQVSFSIGMKVEDADGNGDIKFRRQLPLWKVDTKFGSSTIYKGTDFNGISIAVCSSKNDTHEDNKIVKRLANFLNSHNESLE